MRTKSKGGRPTKIDQEVEVIGPRGERRTMPVSQAILEDVAVGVPQEAAAKAYGVARSTLHSWKQQGSRKPKSAFGAFWIGLETARAKAHARLAKTTYLHAMKDGKLGLQVLKTREPSEWAEPETRLQLSGKKGKPVEVQDVMAANLYAKLERMAKGGKGNGGE